jgi:protein involved in polysaccharide export with SLBB domain
MFGYLLKNDLTYNPYLSPSDNITITPANKRIFLNASSKSVATGWIPIRNNETLSQFLSLFSFDALVDTSTILLDKFTIDGRSVIQEVNRKEADSDTLFDREIITIPQKKNYTPVLLIEVSGEVARPGFYPITRDSTSVDKVIAMAGGYTQYASAERAVIVRQSKINEKMKRKPQSALIPEQSPEAAVRPELYAGLKKMSTLEDFSVIEIKKYKTGITLVSEDHIVVPRKDIFVYVSGDVKYPGAYKYCSGKTFRYYIDAAGGFTVRADRGNVFGLRYFEDASQMTDLSEIHEGDIIVVPDSQQAKMLSTVILPIFQAIVTSLSVGLAIFSLTKK